MPVLKYTSISCRVQDYLNALSASMNRPFTLVGPSGKAITDKLEDIPMIGLATKKGHPKEPFGFKLPRLGYSLSAPSVFDADGELILDIKSEELPRDLAGLSGLIWLIRLNDDSMLDYYLEIATKLNAEFKELGVTIIVWSGKITDEDPGHEAASSGPTPLCHVIPHEK